MNCEGLVDVADLVEATLPVVAHHQHVGSELQAILALLLKRLLSEDLIDTFERFEDELALRIRIDGRAILLAHVELIAAQANDEATPKRACPLKDANVTVVQHLQR